MTMEFIMHVLICSVGIVGIHEVTRPGMVLEKIGTISVGLFGEFWAKPFTECLTCMASIWGTTYFSLMCDFVGYPHPVRLWVVFMLVVAGANATYGNLFYRNE